MNTQLDAFREIQDLELQGVLEIREHDELVSIEFDFGISQLTLRANQDDDSLEISVGRSDPPPTNPTENLNPPCLWKETVGRKFGWGWVTINQQGYLDGVLLSFDGFIPGIIVNVVASSLKIGSVQMQPHRK